jgi:hypothetical protein
MSRANPFLSDDVLAASRAVLRRTLTSFATIERPGTAATAGGGAWTRVVIVLAEHTPRTASAARVYVCEDAGPGRR